MPTFRSSVESGLGERPSYAIVRDASSAISHAKDFIVAEAGKLAADSRLPGAADGPVKLAMLFDISGSMRVGTEGSGCPAGGTCTCSAR